MVRFCWCVAGVIDAAALCSDFPAKSGPLRPKCRQACTEPHHLASLVYSKSRSGGSRGDSLRNLVFFLGAVKDMTPEERGAPASTEIEIFTREKRSAFSPSQLARLRRSASTGAVHRTCRHHSVPCVEAFLAEG